MTLQQQLNYNWERGFYSVVKGNGSMFGIISTQSKSGSFRFSGWCRSVESAKLGVGMVVLGYLREDVSQGEIEEIVDTIHPSELMGNGFQVGDKVYMISDKEKKEFEIEEVDIDQDGLVALGGMLFNPIHLKPVLPVEEEKITVTHKSHICGCRVWDCESRSSGAKWFFANGSNEWIELMPNVEYAICSKCMKKINQCDVDAAVKLLKEKGIIKDGHIVNL
jgi:hypothetical protein